MDDPQRTNHTASSELATWFAWTHVPLFAAECCRARRYVYSFCLNRGVGSEEHFGLRCIPDPCLEVHLSGVLFCSCLPWKGDCSLTKATMNAVLQWVTGFQAQLPYKDERIRTADHKSTVSFAKENYLVLVCIWNCFDLQSVAKAHALPVKRRARSAVPHTHGGTHPRSTKRWIALTRAPREAQMRIFSREIEGWCFFLEGSSRAWKECVYKLYCACGALESACFP